MATYLNQVQTISFERKKSQVAIHELRHPNNSFREFNFQLPQSLI